MNVQFKEWNCIVEKHAYSNGRPALMLVDAKNGMPICKATVNLPELNISNDDVAIKDSEENDGILAALIDAGVVAHPHNYAEQGFCTYPICTLL